MIYLAPYMSEHRLIKTSETVVIKTLRSQMLYGLPRWLVEAARPSTPH